MTASRSMVAARPTVPSGAKTTRGPYGKSCTITESPGRSHTREGWRNSPGPRPLRPKLPRKPPVASKMRTSPLPAFTT